MRRRQLAVPSLVLSVALLLGACSPEGDAESSPSESSTEGTSSATEPTEVPSVENVVAGDDVGFTAAGEFGEKPTLEFTADAPTEGLQVETVTEGDGAEVQATDTVVAHYQGQIFGTETVFDNSYDRGAPTSFSLAQVIPGWTTGLTGQKVGSRVLISVPSFLGYPEGREDIKPGDTIVFVVDLVGLVPTEGSGQADAAPTDAEVPVTITGDLGQPITAVAVAEGTPEPTEPSVTVLATGTGPEIAEGASVGVQYYLTTWDGTQTEVTWAPEGPGVAPATIGQGTPFDVLVGVPEGSRVLMQLPADAANGSPALAVVVDVVAVVAP